MAKPKPIRRHASRKQPNEPSVEDGVWFKCSDDEYAAFECAATNEGLEWVNHWAMMHLTNVCRFGQSKPYDFPPTGKTADHIQPGDRSGAGVWIDSAGSFDKFTEQATQEQFPTVLHWGLFHLRNIAADGNTHAASAAA